MGSGNTEHAMRHIMYRIVKKKVGYAACTAVVAHDLACDLSEVLNRTLVALARNHPDQNKILEQGKVAFDLHDKDAAQKVVLELVLERVPVALATSLRTMIGIVHAMHETTCDVSQGILARTRPEPGDLSIEDFLDIDFE